MGRFQSSRDPLVLLATMRAVLHSANPEHPERVTQRSYDAARAAAGHPDSPRADKLVARFGVGWALLLDRVLFGENTARDLGLANMKKLRRVLTEAEAAEALRRVGRRLDVRELTADQYEVARVAMNEETDRRYSHGTHLLPLPSALTVQRGIGWPRALAAAGLDPAPIAVPASLDRWEAVVIFVEHFGFVPRAADLAWVARKHGIQLAGKMVVPHTQVVARARERFTALGYWFPPSIPGRLQPPDWQERDMSALATLAARYPRKRTNHEPYTLDEVRAAITVAFDALPPGQRLTTDRYRTMSAGLGLVSYKTVFKICRQSNTSFKQLLREEADRRAAALVVAHRTS